MVQARKLEYGRKLVELLGKYTKIMIITIDNVGSKALADTRKKLRGRGEILMGKNTMVRKVLRDYVKETNDEKIKNLIPLVGGNCGFVFTKEDVTALRDEIEADQKQCSAKAGALAPDNVTVPAGPTGMEPTMTGFFQALGIPTKINRGQIDIVDPQQLVTKGEKVGMSEAELLAKLGIKPFYYGIKVAAVYDDGQTYSAAVLSLTPADIAGAFCKGMCKVAGLCLQLDYPTIVSVPQSVLLAYKEVLALAIGVDAPAWEHLTYIKDVLADPSKFMGSGGGGGGGGAGGDAAAAVVEKEPTPEPESSVAAGGMFGSGSGSGSDSDSDSSS